jgi:hypothetical protein
MSAIQRRPGATGIHLAHEVSDMSVAVDLRKLPKIIVRNQYFGGRRE